MPASTRRPGAGEYRDMKGRIRVSKPKLTPRQQRAIMQAKQRRAEKATSRKQIAQSLSVNENSMLMKHVFRVEARISGEMVGWATRGHRQVMKFTKKGIFAKMLRNIEQKEKQIFQAGEFEGYKESMLISIGITNLLTPALEKTIREIKEPTHIDYTHIPSVALSLIKRGYKITPYTYAVSESFHRPLPAERKALEKKLKGNDARSPVLFLLTKPAK